MRNGRGTLLILGAALGAFAIGVVACGGDDETPSPAAEPSTAPTDAPAQSPTKAPAPTTAPTTEAEAEVIGIEEIDGASVLVDSRGYTLYTFDSDVPQSGTSACSGECSNAWPSLEAWDASPVGPQGLTRELAAIKRADGILQLTYGGWPLYLYSGDTAPGHTNGDGVGGVWHVATVDLDSTASAGTPDY